MEVEPTALVEVEAPLAASAMIAAMLVPLALALTGCSINLSTTLRADGSGITTILAQESRDNMDFLRSAPGVSGYLTTLLRDLRKSGATFEQYVQGDQEFIMLQRNLNSTAADAGNTYPVQGSWISVQRYTEGSEIVVRFLGVVDTRTLYADMPGVGSDVSSMLQDQLNQIGMMYHLNLPGSVVYQNGDQASPRRVTWQLKMNDVNYLVAEARFPAQSPQATAIFSRYAWIGIGAVFLLSTLLLLASLLIRVRATLGGRSA